MFVVCVCVCFLCCVGSVELAAVGVSASVFNLVSKLFNVPLLNITTSFVAEEQALAIKAKDSSNSIGPDGNYTPIPLGSLAYLLFFVHCFNK